MERVAREAGFPSREAFIQELRTNPRYYPTSAEQLIAGLGARSTRRSTAGCRACSARLPRLTFTIREIPAETAEGTTTAYYSQGSPESGIAGTYYVNTSRLNQRPLWEIPALSLHESVPGHHLQIALQQEMDLAPFRRNFTSYTAFTEGWALYAESLGEEMGALQHARAADGRALLPDVARLPAGGRHRHPRLRLGQGAGDRTTCATTPRSPTPISRPRSTATSAGRARRWAT